MAPRGTGLGATEDLSRALGRVEGLLNGLDEKVDGLAKRDSELATAVRVEIADLREHVERVDKRVGALERLVLDGRALSKGLVIGVGLTSGGLSAGVALLLKSIFAGWS